MSTRRQACRVNGSTRHRISSMPRAVVERSISKHDGLARRDLNPGPATLERKWTAKPLKGEVARQPRPKALCDAGSGKGGSLDHPSTRNFVGKEAR